MTSEDQSPAPAAAAVPGMSTRPGTARPQPAVPASPSSPLELAVAGLAGLDSVPLHEHPDIYQGIHAELQSALASIDDA